MKKYISILFMLAAAMSMNDSAQENSFLHR